MVELRAIIEENFIDAFNLKLASGQEEYARKLYENKGFRATGADDED